MYIPPKHTDNCILFLFYFLKSVILKTALLSRIECVWLLIVYIFDLNARTNNRIIVEDYFNNRSNLHRVIDVAELQRMVSDDGSIRGGLHGGRLEGVCGGAGRKEEREKQTKRL